MDKVILKEKSKKFTITVDTTNGIELTVNDTVVSSKDEDVILAITKAGSIESADEVIKALVR